MNERLIAVKFSEYLFLKEIELNLREYNAKTLEFTERTELYR